LSRVLVTTSSFGKEDPSVIMLLREAGFEVVLNPFGRKLTEEEVMELLLKVQPVAMIAGVEPLTARVLRSMSGLRVISRCGIGMDTVDLEAAGIANINVLNTPDAPTQPVAELTVGLILAVLRNIVETDANIRIGSWKRPMGRLLGAQTAGIVGCGRIGTAVARLLRAFGSELIGYDPYIKEHKFIPLAPLEQLLAKADIVSLHLPYVQPLHHLFNRELLGKMKRGSVIINTSRGGLIDEGALHDALASEHLAGAGLDTFESEPYTGTLVSLPNIVLTPHIGSYAKEARMKMEREAVLNLLSAL
jgi:D-3-phosphoglycerate dehydrogenase